MVDNLRPSPPTDAKVNNVAESPEMVTKSTGTIHIKARVDDPNAGQQVRLLAQIVTTGDAFTPSTSPLSGAFYVGNWVNQTQFSEVTMLGLKQNTLYKVDLYTEDKLGRRSASANRVSFWMNRSPSAPELVAPADNVQFLSSSPVLFDWNFSDPDGDVQKRYQIRWRVAATAVSLPGPWAYFITVTPTTSRNQAGDTFQPNQDYEWQVRVQDTQDAWSGWSVTRSFFVLGVSAPPLLRSPIRDVAVEVDQAALFEWDFRDPDQSDFQVKADLRYRAVGTIDWFTLFGDTTTPGLVEEWQIPLDTFVAGVHYEWQVRTYDDGSGGATPSDWSDSATFWSINTVGAAVTTPPIPDDLTIQGALGCGTHRVFIADRGGMVIRGEITPLAHVLWHRKRDDISHTLVTTNGFSEDCGELLGGLRSWMHELIIYRDGERVFEGPITRITYGVNNVEIEAKDVMAYVYRRIMRQGYNDSYHVVKGKQLGLTTVVKRAGRIIMNALAYYDPNVLPYLTLINNPGDAPQSRVVADYSRTAWEEVDDLAATAGLDYTTVGRRIMLWDTHRAIGKLPEMRDEHFSDPPIVTEYGMQLANYFAVTNNSGVWGAVYPDESDPANPFEFYGPIEQLASAYGEADAAPIENLTPTATNKMRESLIEQARRNINNRWPTPLIVRVPDNSTINPETNLGINQLIPGVWIPLRATGTVRQVAQWQKLDSVTVEEQSGKEQVRVVMSPTPNGGNDDPDQGQEVETE